jgi:hypothetical protein
MKDIIANGTAETLLEILLLILITMVQKKIIFSDVDFVTVLPGTSNRQITLSVP